MDKELLFKPRLPEADVEIEGVGTVRVRGLSRIEVMLVQKIEDVGAREARILAYGMVDPSLTEAEAGRWQRASMPMELNPVTDTIVELSGLNPEAPKEAYKSVRDESGDGVHVLPGAEAGDDGGSTPGGDEQ